MAIQWIKVAESVADLGLGNNNIAEVQAGNKVICISRFEEKLSAFAAKCPHAGGKMAGGWIDAKGDVVCPLHRYRFCPHNGRNVSGEGYYLSHWPVEVRADGVWVGFKEQSWSSIWKG